MSIVVEMWD